MSCSSAACDWTTERKRSHSNSTQLTAVSHSSGDVIAESAHLQVTQSATIVENVDEKYVVMRKIEKVVVVRGSRELQKTKLQDLQVGA